MYCQGLLGQASLNLPATEHQHEKADQYPQSFTNSSIDQEVLGRRCA